LSQAPTDVIQLLGPNERVELYIKQKVYHPTIKVDSVLLTNERIILRHPRDLGLKKDYTDFSYTDIANVVLDRGILRSTVKCMLRFGGDPLSLTELPNADAEKAYGIIRENLVKYQTPLSYTPGAAGIAPAVPAQIITREIVKVRCKSCNGLMDETATQCPSCGANQ
jgi:hypothetical protein